MLVKVQIRCYIGKLQRPLPKGASRRGRRRRGRARPKPPWVSGAGSRPFSARGWPEPQPCPHAESWAARAAVKAGAGPTVPFHGQHPLPPRTHQSGAGTLKGHPREGFGCFPSFSRGLPPPDPRRGDSVVGRPWPMPARGAGCPGLMAAHAGPGSSVGVRGTGRDPPPPCHPHLGRGCHRGGTNAHLAVVPGSGAPGPTRWLHVAVPHAPGSAARRVQHPSPGPGSWPAPSRGLRVSLLPMRPLPVEATALREETELGQSRDFAQLVGARCEPGAWWRLLLVRCPL